MFCQKVESQIGPPCADLVSDVIIRDGYPVEEILNAADTEGCDIIVLGTHGKGLLKQAFLGNIARSVLERTRKPVFIIPLPSETTSADWGCGVKCPWGLASQQGEAEDRGQSFKLWPHRPRRFRSEGALSPEVASTYSGENMRFFQRTQPEVTA